jgi:hypothetical protein
MALINLRRILTTDTVSQQVDKTNYNFEQIALAGGGPVGPTGTGIQGIPGGPGRQGTVGPAGTPGELWYLDTIDPPSLNIQAPAVGAQTIWLNVTTGHFFQWNGTVWVDEGSFTVSNFWSKTGDMIFNTDYTDQLVLSDEEDGLTSAPLVSNTDAFLLKINSTGGAHIIMTNGVNNDAEGVTFRLTATDFFLDSVSSLVNLNITSQKGIILNSLTDTTFTSNQNIYLNSVANINSTSSAGSINVRANQQLNFYSSIFQTFIQSKVGISTGPLFNPSEYLQVGTPTSPGNILVSRGNGLNDGNLKFARNGYQIILDTNPLTQTQNVHLPNLTGEVAVLRDFNDLSQFTDDWVKNEVQYSFGYTLNSGGGYTYKHQMVRGTGFYQVGSGAILEQIAGANPYGATFFVTTYYKIVGEIVLFRWNMLVKTYASDSSVGSEDVLGISFPLPFDSAFLSANSIQAASPIETTTGDNFSVNRTRTTHNGNLLQGTANFENKNFVFQVSPTRNGSSSFTGSKLIILLANTHFEYNTGNYYTFTGEASLAMVDLVNTTDTVSVLADLSNYLTATPVAVPYSTSIPYRGCIVYSPSDLTKFDSTGKGISGDVIGFQICNGQGTSPDFRGRTVYQYDSGNPRFETIGQIGGNEQTSLININIPKHEHGLYGESGNKPEFGGGISGWWPANPEVINLIPGATATWGGDPSNNGETAPFDTISPYITALWIMNIINPNFGVVITTTTIPSGIYAEITMVNEINNRNIGTTYSNTMGDIIVSFYSDAGGTIPYSVSGITFNYQQKTIYVNYGDSSLDNTSYNNISIVCSGTMVTLLASQIVSETYWTDTTQTAPSETNVQDYTGEVGVGYTVIGSGVTTTPLT